MYFEDKTTELKSEYIESIKNTVIAFANCDGGTIYIGINDDGTICGLENADSTMLRASNAIRDAIRPDVTMFVECSLQILEEKPVVCINVQRGTARPYYLQGKGIRPEGVYVRQGASTVPATQTAIVSMIKETSGDSYEAARSLNQSLTFNAVSDYFKKRKLEFGQAQMRTLHMIAADESYTNLAFLLSEQCTHTTKLAVFEGNKKTVFKDRQELSGSLLKQMEEAFAFIDRNNRTRADFLGLERIDTRDYPPEAIREALLNAMIHRDYSFNSPTLVSIFDDRIEFVTIGGLVNGITLSDVMLGVSVLRNQFLANIFYRLHLIEAYGTGILKINECYANYDVKPNIETSDNAFKITLPNINYYNKEQAFSKSAPTNTTICTSKKELYLTTILTLCRTKGFIVRSDIEASLNVSQSTAILLLRELVENGTLLKEGKGKNTRYFARE